MGVPLEYRACTKKMYQHFHYTGPTHNPTVCCVTLLQSQHPFKKKKNPINFHKFFFEQPQHLKNPETHVL